MKAVFRSIKAYWLYLILIGKKTIEVGKDYPKSDDWNKIVYLYCSKDMKSFNRIPEKDREWMRKYLGKVACVFVCDKIHEIIPHFDTPTFPNQYICGWDYGKEFDCLSFEELTSYLNGKKGYGWHISDLVIYDKPKELGEFKKPCNHKNDCCTCDRYDYIGHKCYDEITRPFQSWGYIEELGV